MLRAHLPSNSPRQGAVLSGSRSWYRHGRQIGLCLMSQKQVGKLSSFYLSTIIAFILITIFTLLLYYHSYIHYLFTFLLPAYLLLFFIFVALPIEVNPLSNLVIVKFGSVELPKTTHLPKTTENHLENHIYRGIIPS